MGKSLELISINFDKKPNLDLFTTDRYNSISTKKTAYYTYVLPVTAAMHLVSFLIRKKTTLLVDININAL